MKTSMLLVSAAVLLSAAAANSDTITDNFSQSTTTGRWNVVQSSAVGAPWAIQTPGSGLEISKPADSDSTTSLSVLTSGVLSSFTLDGDLSVSVGYNLSNFPLSNNLGWNELILALHGTNGPLWCEGMRYSNSSNQLAEGYSSLGGLTAMGDTSTSGTLTISRSGQTVSVWINHGSGAIPLGSVTSPSMLGPVKVQVSLNQQPGSETNPRPTTALDATFSNLTATADTIAPGVLQGPVAHNGHTYYLLSNSTWTQAEAEAVQMGGHLVTINDADEQAWLFNTFSNGGNRFLWTGLNDVANVGQYVWTSGEPATFMNFNPGEPNNPGVEDYVASTLPDGKWNNLANVYQEDSGYLMYGVVEVVPEPASLSLLALGGLALFRRKRN